MGKECRAICRGNGCAAFGALAVLHDETMDMINARLAQHGLEHDIGQGPAFIGGETDSLRRAKAVLFDQDVPRCEFIDEALDLLGNTPDRQECVWGEGDDRQGDEWLCLNSLRLLKSLDASAGKRDVTDGGIVWNAEFVHLSADVVWNAATIIDNETIAGVAASSLRRTRDDGGLTNQV